MNQPERSARRLPAAALLAAAAALLLAAGAAPAQESAARQQNETADESRKHPLLPDHEILNEFGVISSSGHDDGGWNLPPELRVPEQYQYRRRDLQLKEVDLTGNQLPPVLTEMRVLSKEVAPGGEVRAMARVVSPYNKAQSFVSLFYNRELGRAATMYINFKPNEKDDTLFLGRGKLSKYAAPGRYVVGTTIIADKVGDRKAYWADFHTAMQEDDGQPIGFQVTQGDSVDIQAPTLVSVEVETDRVRAGGGLIRYSVLSEDDVSGPTEAETVWVSPSGYHQIRSTMVMVGGQPGLFRGALQIPQWYEGGEWYLMRVSLKDNATNIRYYFNRTEPKMAAATVQVDQEREMVDQTPAKVLAVQFTKTEAKLGEEVGITVLAEDDLSGVRGLEGYVRSPNGADALKVKLKSLTPEMGGYVALNRPSKLPEPHIWTGSFTVTDTMEWGEWELVRLGISDAARNFYTYYEGRDPEIEGISVRFYDEDTESAESGGKEDPR